jgi:hypothetical protein
VGTEKHPAFLDPAVYHAYEKDPEKVGLLGSRNRQPTKKKQKNRKRRGAPSKKRDRKQSANIL